MRARTAPSLALPCRSGGEDVLFSASTLPSDASLGVVVQPDRADRDSVHRASLQPPQPFGPVLFGGVYRQMPVRQRVLHLLDEELPVGTRHDGLLVGLHQGNGIAGAAAALIEDQRVGEAEQRLVLGDPRGDFDATDLLAGVKVEEVYIMALVVVSHEARRAYEDGRTLPRTQSLREDVSVVNAPGTLVARPLTRPDEPALPLAIGDVVGTHAEA